MDGVAERFEEKGSPLITLTNFDILLATGLETGYWDPETVETLQEWRNGYQAVDVCKLEVSGVTRLIASIVTVGEELLIGQVLDTNAAYLAEELTRLGVPIVRSWTVGDDKEAIKGALAEGMQHGRLTVLTGGLGPTPDDGEQGGRRCVDRIEPQRGHCCACSD